MMYADRLNNWATYNNISNTSFTEIWDDEENGRVVITDDWSRPVPEDDEEEEVKEEEENEEEEKNEKEED